MDMKQFGKTYYDGGVAVKNELEDELMEVVRDKAVGKMISNLEKAQTSGGSPFAELSELTMLIRAESGVAGSTPGTASGALLEDLESPDAVKRTGRFKFSAGPASQEQEQIAEYLAQPNEGATSELQEGFFFAATGGGAFVPAGSTISKPGRDFGLNEHALQDVINTAGKVVNGFLLEKLGHGKVTDFYVGG
jgi:hypothetical protein